MIFKKNILFFICPGPFQRTLYFSATLRPPLKARTRTLRLVKSRRLSLPCGTPWMRNRRTYVLELERDQMREGSNVVLFFSFELQQVYKKKTEAAKKEYLKALAAYRASVVSKEGNNGQNNEGSMFQAGNSAPPAQQQQNVATQNFANYQSNYNMPPQQQQQQPQYTATMAVTSAPMPQQPVSPMSKKPSPLLNSLMVDQQQQQQLHLHQQQQMQQQHQQQQQQQNMLNYPMQNNRPAYMNQQPQMIQNAPPHQV